MRQFNFKIILASILVIIISYIFYTTKTRINKKENSQLDRYCDEYIITSFKIAEACIKQGYKPNYRNIIKVVETVERIFDNFGFKYITKKDVYALFIVENPRFDNKAIGRHGEKGLGQLLEETIKCIRKETKKKLDPFKIEDNVYMTLYWLKRKVDIFKDEKIGIIAYNGLVKNNNGIIRKYLDKVERIKEAL